jgi:hypothetical protein
MLRYPIVKLLRLTAISGPNRRFQGVRIMMKKGSFLQIAIIAVFALTVIGIGTSVAAGRERPHVIRSNNVMILEYDFDEPDIITEGDIDFVTINGLERYSKAGAPVIPVKPVEILVPAGMKIAGIKSIAADSEQLPGTYSLSHGQKPQRRPSYGEEFKPVAPTQPDPEIFEMTTFWPVEQHDLVTVQTNRGYDIAYVNLFPLQYSPKPGKIKMATKMLLIVRLADADSEHNAKPTKHLKKKLERKLDNPDTMESYDTDSTEDSLIPAKSSGDQSPLEASASSSLGDLPGPYQYVVITSASLAGYSGANSFQDLCDSKIARGISAGIVTTEWIYANYDGTKPGGGSDNATRIRNFLIDAYGAWSTEYALLAGDKDIIPVRYLKSDGTNIPADLYYGCVAPSSCTFDNDGDGTYGESNDGPGGGEVDLTAEIFIGRAAVENSTDVTNFVNKTLVYGTIDDPYLNEGATMGGYLGFGGVQEYTKPFAELLRLGSSLYLGHHTYGFEDTIVANARDFHMTTLYDADGIWPVSELIAILNGTGGNITPQMFYISDHGSTTVGMVKLNTSTLSNLNNTRPFFFYDDSCDVGHFDSANCFGEVVTTMEHGAFACILNSRSGWGSSTGDNLDSPTTQLTREFFHSVFGKGIFELGCAHLEAKESCIWRLWYTRWDIYQSTLFGDPELQLRVTDVDETPPTPDPMTFEIPPYAASETSVAMVATTAGDSSGVEYLFTCTAGGGHDSSWLPGTTYTDTGLTPGIEYSYTVTARDLSPARNATGASDEASVIIPVPCSTCGDLDGEGVNVNLVDFALFADCWGKDPLINSECACANLVEFDHHTIDILDLAVLAELFLSGSSDYPSDCSTSITDPYPPTPDAMTFATAPIATGSTSILMVATTATDISGVEYYFTCTSGGGHDSGWQPSPTYEDTSLLPETTYTYTVKARDLSVNYNETAASAGASATTDDESVILENVVLPANGGVLESFTSEYGSGWAASDLTNGVTSEDGWSSKKDPGVQEFVYSFRGGNNATLSEAVIYGGTGEGQYFSKNVEVWTSANGTSFTLAGNDTLLKQSNDSVTIDLGDVVAKKVKLKITSGYRSDYWELGEFVVNGVVID